MHDEAQEVTVRPRAVMLEAVWALTTAMLLLLASSASAQTRGFVSGDLFADLKRFSTADTTNSLNGNAIGAGFEGGIFLAPEWSLSVVLDLGRTTTGSRPIPIGVLASVDASSIPIRFQSQTTNRIIATSVLVGYHVAIRQRMHLGALAGVSFLHVTRAFNALPPVPLASSAASSPAFAVGPALIVRPYMVVDNVPAATVGGELAIDLARHFALVPELRAHAFSLSGGGPSGFAIRPGLAARWIF
jgi:hypothetical protein